MRRVILFSAIAMAAMSGTALAADASAFDGFYGGVMLGYAGTAFEGVVDSSEIADDLPEEAEIFSGERVFGLAYGGVIGVNYVDQDKVFGLEASVLAGNLSDMAIDDGGNDYSTHELDAVALLSARAGLAVTDDTLLFAKVGAGVAVSTFTAYNDMDDIVDAESDSLRLLSPVIAVGAGVEQAVSDTVSLRLDGTYILPVGQYDFADEELTSDMDEGDYARIGGTLVVTAGVVARF